MAAHFADKLKVTESKLLKFLLLYIFIHVSEYIDVYIYKPLTSVFCMILIYPVQVSGSFFAKQD